MTFFLTHFYTINTCNILYTKYRLDDFFHVLTVNYYYLEKM